MCGLWIILVSVHLTIRNNNNKTLMMMIMMMMMIIIIIIIMRISGRYNNVQNFLCWSLHR